MENYKLMSTHVSYKQPFQITTRCILLLVDHQTSMLTRNRNFKITIFVFLLTEHFDLVIAYYNTIVIN